MFWRGSFTSLMALIFWGGLVLFIGGFFAYFDFAFLTRAMSDPMVYGGGSIMLGTFVIRIVAFFADLVFIVLGKPLFYDLQITDDLNVRQ